MAMGLPKRLSAWKVFVVVFLIATQMHAVDAFANADIGFNPSAIAAGVCEDDPFGVCDAIVEAVLTAVSGFINTVVCPIIDGLNAIINETVGKIGEIASVLANGIKTFGESVAKFAVKAPETLATLGETLVTFTTKAPETLATLGETIVTLASNAPQVLSTVSQQISTMAQKGPETIGMVAEHAATLAEKAPETLGLVAEQASELAQRAPETLGKLGETASLFGDASLSNLEALTELSTSTFPTLVEESMSTLTTFSDTLDELFNDGLFEQLSELADNTTTMFEDFTEGFDENIGKVTGFLESDGFAGIADQITGLGEGLFDQLDFETVSNLLEEIKQGLPEIGELKETLQTGVGDAVALIPDVIEGLANAQSSIDTLRGTVLELATDPEKVTSILDSLLSIAVESAALASPAGLLAQQKALKIQLEAAQILLEELPGILNDLPGVLESISQFDASSATSLLQGIPAQIDNIPNLVRDRINGFVTSISSDITGVLDLVPLPQLETFKKVLALSARDEPNHIAAEQAHSKEIASLLENVNGATANDSMMSVAAGLERANEQLKLQLDALEQELAALKSQTLSESSELDALRTQNRWLIESLGLIKEKLTQK